ncbi:hypothetical protein BDF20DRAFT_814864 [Mycotypha africana]|uniref:uncharacterized protein n=1 Tax=Mycotypha africana TaxID=64632 RepID=UPI0022FFD024|nr:uncharacterized protein BDF20DRAFT_814864 [Mycotypha africana]KAI8987420.1 hypothetical protein BDF20DRAFT_814864 [Mycotypha africana]
MVEPKKRIPEEYDYYKTYIPQGGLELPRKLFHCSIGFLVVYLYTHGVTREDVYPILSLALSIVYSGELLRFNFEWFNKIYCKVLGSIMRPTEVRDRLNGTVYYLIGCIVALYFFPTDLAALSILYLSWADPIASLIGRSFGKYTPKIGGSHSKKSLAGSLAALVTGALVTYLYFGTSPFAMCATSYNALLSIVPLWVLSLYGGLVAAFSEGVSDLCPYLANVDDNLSIPVISVVLLWIPLVWLRLGS